MTPMASALVALSMMPAAKAMTMVSIIVSGTLDLNFGTFTGGAAGGTVTIPVTGARTSTGSVVLVSGAGLEAPGSISISASTGVSVVVSMDAASYSIDDSGAGAPMSVDNFDIDGGGQTVTVSMTANPITLPLGGRLNVGAAQAEGIYSGFYVVNANYL